MIDLISNINFWSAFLGLVGTIMIFFFGFPPKIDPEGNSYLLIESSNYKEKNKASLLKKLSYVGLSLVGASFFLQILSLVI